VRECSSSPCDFFVDLVYSIPIDIIEVLRERLENTATTIRNNRGMMERVEESFRRRLHYCIDNNGGHFEYSV
jgi:ribosomal protein S6